MARGANTLYEISGHAAQIANSFGPDTHRYPPFTWLENHFSLRGSHRISIVKSNQRFVFVETYCNLAWPYLEDTLRDWTGMNTYKFYSIEGPNPMLETPEYLELPTFFPSNGFWSYYKGAQRYLGVTKEALRWNYFQDGQITPFEQPEHYTKRRRSDRMNREIVVEYMLALGIDPFSVFERRELEKPILFTSDHVGQTVDLYEAERQRYELWFKGKFGSMPDHEYL